MADAARSPLVLVAAAVFLHGDRVLLTRRAEGTHLAGTWEFPGGKIEVGESPEEALVREIREELSIDTDVVEPFRFVHHEYPEKRVLLLTYLCRARTDPERPPEDWRWVPVRDLDDSAMPPADRVLVRALKELPTMTASLAALLALFVVFLLISAFFAASETALVALSRIEIQKMRERGSPGAAIVENLKRQPARLLSAALIGQNLANSAASAVATVVAENFLGERAGIAVAVVCSTLLLFSVGEMAPKSLAAAAPARIALFIARPFQLFTRVVSPVAAVVIYIVNKTIGALGLPLGHVTMTEEEMKAVINMGHAEGVIRGEERERMVRVLEFGERRVSDVMVPRPKIVAIASDAPFSEVKALFSSHKFSRIPVYRDSLDDVIGVLRAKDLFDLTDEQERTFTPSAFAAPSFLVPESKRLEELFREMRRRKQHLAIAVDEYGGTAGLVTIEDIIESLLGSIHEDEYDEESPGFVKLDDRTYILEGTYRLEELESRFGVRYPGADAETVAGLLLQRFGRIPNRGERLRGRQAEYVVLDSTPMAIRRIKMVLPKSKAAPPANR